MKKRMTPLALIAALAACLALPAQAQEPRVLKFGYGIAEDHPLGQGVNKFVQLVDQRGGGRIKVKAFPSNVLGSESAMISSAQGGVQEIVGASSAPVVQLVKEFAVFDLPFLFGDEKEADAVLDGPVGRELLDKLNPRGLVGLCYWETGFRHVTNSKRPITKAEDLKGLKLRVMQNPVYIDAFKTLGANAVPMPFTELYAALESRAIDAQENPYGIIHANKMNEVQKYLSATRHAYSPFVVMVSKKVWDKLSPDDHKVLNDACVESRDFQRKLNRESNASLVADMRAKGLQFNDIPPAEAARMRTELQPVVDKYSKQIGEDLVKQVYAEIDKVRKQK
ncbi:TRAP transporter substrate-binding protein [Curvibacter sp. HBC61]|uniref:TRAP transporter substrate-binding protein n=1 Tax=Curvibacter cyanobacteriorum TaxID=3026422 RepID=A0ABT5N0Q1_9BURK|nr:TRAP transporter substrate-binding protein [Curvibacter sp. HBC61]MDD0839892.1 TRAP transporter substrate-binding protein [Curvibacter sp. HBC61]